MIVVGFDDNKVVDQRILNLLRLTFCIEPLFFWSLRNDFTFLRRRDFLKIGCMSFKILRNYPTTSGDVSVGKNFSKNDETRG